MKSFICITILILSIIALTESVIVTKAERDITFKAVAESCKTETGATDSDLEMVLKRQPDSTKTGRCLRECIMNKFSMLLNGKPNKSGIMIVANILFEENADKVKLAEQGIDECMKVELPADKCDAAEEFLLCLKKQAQALGLQLEL